MGWIAKNRARFVQEVYREIRKQVGLDYPVGIKINSADFQKGGLANQNQWRSFNFFPMKEWT